MDATLGAMRSASNQFRASDDCVKGKVGVAVESSAGRSPSKLSFNVGSMMTLLWATKCLEREYLRNGFINMEVNDDDYSSPIPAQSSSIDAREKFTMRNGVFFDDVFLAWDLQQKQRRENPGPSVRRSLNIKEKRQWSPKGRRAFTRRGERSP